MKNNKIPNFVSAIIYLASNSKKIENIALLDKYFHEKFQKTQFIIVNNCISDDQLDVLNKLIPNLNAVTKIVHLNIKHSKELAQKAGLDISIGDMIFEFDTIDIDYDLDSIEKLYNIATTKNKNLVSLQTKSTGIKRLMYNIIEKETKTNNISSEPLRVISRRMVNEVHLKNYINRKVLYRETGLPHEVVIYKSSNPSNTEDKINLLFETLFTHSDFLVKTLLKITSIFFILTFIVAVWIVYNLLSNDHILSGWGSIMLTLLGMGTAIMSMLLLISKFLSVIFEERHPNNYKMAELEIVEPKDEDE